jgi:hypothetical protein
LLIASINLTYTRLHANLGGLVQKRLGVDEPNYLLNVEFGLERSTWPQVDVLLFTVLFINNKSDVSSSQSLVSYILSYTLSFGSEFEEEW